MNNVHIIVGNEERWANNLALVKEYIDENNKLPLRSVDGSSLGRWFSGQKNNYDPDITMCKQGMKNEEIWNLWTEFINDENYRHYFVSNEERWANNLALVKEYIDENNKLPLRSVDGSCRV